MVILIPIIISRFLTQVPAGTIRLVSRFGGSTKIYKGPGKAVEVPLLTTGTTIPSKAINIDLDIADQTADVDKNGQPKPIKVRVLASAIVSVGDSNEMITTAANKFFSKPVDEQTATLSDLLTSTGRRAVNLLNHDELFSAKAQREMEPLAPGHRHRPRRRVRPGGGRRPAGAHHQGRLFPRTAGLGTGLQLPEHQRSAERGRRGPPTPVAPWRPRPTRTSSPPTRSAAPARRSLTAEQAINDKQRDLEQRRAQNAATIAEAEAQKQTALAIQREAELKATQHRPGQCRCLPRPYPGRSRSRRRGRQGPHPRRGPGRRHPRRQRRDPSGRRRLSCAEAARDPAADHPGHRPGAGPGETDQHQRRRRTAGRGRRGHEPDHRRHPDPARDPAGQWTTAPGRRGSGARADLQRRGTGPGRAGQRRGSLTQAVGSATIWRCTVTDLCIFVAACLAGRSNLIRGISERIVGLVAAG